MEKVIYAEYLPIGDISVIILCIMIFALFIGTFIDRNLHFKLFQCIIVSTSAGAFFRLLYNHLLLTGLLKSQILLKSIHCLSHFCYLLTLFIYVYYIMFLVSASEREIKKISVIAGIGLFGFTALEIMDIILYNALSAGRGGHSRSSAILFMAAYIFFLGMIFYLLIKYKDRMIPQITKGICITFILCIVVLIIQGVHGQISFTSIVFLMPGISFMYLLHSNPFDLSTGTLNAESFSLAVRDCYKGKDRFFVLYLNVIETNIRSEFTPQLRFEIYRFYKNAVKKPLLFHLGPSQLLLMFRARDNDDPWEKVNKIVELFNGLYKKYNMDFKAILMENEDSISKSDSYVDFLQFVEAEMPYNSYHYVKKEDVEKYEKRILIRESLEDIVEKKDLNDERILAYCQPVYNVKEQRCDTAEVLMRLKLPELGILPPYLFIPIAEKHDLIHELSLIILNKTCAAIKELLNEGLFIKRVSVNFSIQEMREENFCKDITDIVSSHNIPYEKIAIEITESRNERDFDLVKKKVEELRRFGIKFYLDDFGTGYSNFERIMELPFDIIKFDRSMVIESARTEEGAYMVATFAGMFRKLDYRVLFEGIESEEDEKRCIDMSAQYLQGYRYSMPVEIETLRNYLVTEEEQS